MNTYCIRGEVTALILKGRKRSNTECLIDTSDLPRLIAFGKTWTREKRGGAGCQHEGKRLKLHRWLMNAPEGVEVDHRNRDPFDNRRSTNLRLLTHQQNSCNRKPARNKHGFRGVHFHKPSGKYVAKVRRHYRWIYLGASYSTAAEAGRAVERFIQSEGLYCE